MRLRMRFLNQIVGLFIIVGLLGLAVTIVLVGANQRWFQRSYKFYTMFRSGAGLEAGMPITLKGFEIGRVQKVTFQAAKREVRVDFHVFESYYGNVVLENSVVEHATSPIGIGGGLFFHPGKAQTPARPPLPEGTYIVSMDTDEGKELVRRGMVEREGGDESIGALIANAGPILDNLNLVLLNVKGLSLALEDAIKGDRTNQLGALLGDVDGLVSSLDRIVSGRDQGPAGVILANVKTSTDTLTYAIDRTAAEATLLMADLQKVAKNIEVITADPTGLVPRLIDPKGSLKSFLDDNNAVYDEVIRMIKSLGAVVGELESFAHFVSYSTPQISSVLDQAENVLEGLSNNPLLRGGINQEKQQAPTLGTSRDGGF
jgi:phospholipid/cholesterol/gamma-HCH transport system substrate-binding protein